jgi:hypothetical protein
MWFKTALAYLKRSLKRRKTGFESPAGAWFKTAGEEGERGAATAVADAGGCGRRGAPAGAERRRGKRVGLLEFFELLHEVVQRCAFPPRPWLSPAFVPPLAVLSRLA